MSDYLPIKGGRKYTCGFYLKTQNGPTYVGAQISIHGADKEYLRNLPSCHGGPSSNGEWQEFALPVFVPKEAAFIRIQAYKTENTKPGGLVWVDDFYFGEGIGLEQPPSFKRPFTGEHVRVDSLGNFEIKRGDHWKPFFPLCMYADNARDKTVYSRQGWNVNIWAGSAAQIKQAREAVSDFNPDGMLSGFSIAQYTMPAGWAYNDLGELRGHVKGIEDQGLAQSVLFYYWDNENHHEQWDVPAAVIQTIREIDVDATGRPRRPVFALQGTFNLARVHAAHGLVDVTGTYVGGGVDATGGAGLGDEDAFLILDRQHGQTNPAAIAQFNLVDGAGDMRMRLYNAIILGAKGIGYWRDCFQQCDDEFMSMVGPCETKAWWPDFPNLRREVDQLLPLIRQPHWTEWTATVTDAAGKTATEAVHVGTRNHEGAGYLILVNQTDRQQDVRVSLKGLPYAAIEVHSVFDKTQHSLLKSGVFPIELDPIGIASGTTVLRIVNPD